MNSDTVTGRAKGGAPLPRGPGVWTCRPAHHREPLAADQPGAGSDAALAGGTVHDPTVGHAGLGKAERMLGRWINERGVREQVVIITKGAHYNEDRKRVTPFDITSDLHDSLARLKTDYIDLYILHRDDPDVPVGPIVEILNQHQQAGLISALAAQIGLTSALQRPTPMPKKMD